VHVFSCLLIHALYLILYIDVEDPVIKNGWLESHSVV